MIITEEQALNEGLFADKLGGVFDKIKAMLNTEVDVEAVGRKQSEAMQQVERDLKKAGIDTAKIKTEKDKQAVLSDIDKFLKQVKGLTGGQIAAFVLTNPILWGGIALIVRLLKSQDGSTKDYIEAMQKLRSEVVAIKIK